MNEQIKQLITKADTHAWSIADKYVTRDCCHDGEVNYLWEDAFREKFAELIVRECTDIVDKRKDAAIDASWNVDEAMSNAVWDIEAHFYGVEE